jgi:hypothetical protein
MRRAVLAAGVLAFAACGGGAPSPSPTAASGIRGTVVLGPTCPVQQAGASPCLTPYAATIVVTDSEDRQVARTTARPDGSFQVELPPGEYVILPQPGKPFPQAQPLDVTVVPGEFAEVQINYDTGIR